MVKVIIDKRSGVCGGVNRAIKMVEKKLDENCKDIYINGELLHNRLEMERLIDKGLKVSNDINTLENSTLFIRTHGVGKSSIDDAKIKGNNVIDATCPKVRRSQDITYQLYKERYQIIIVGKSNHPEVIGLLGYCNNEAKIVMDEKDFTKIDFNKKSAILTQTTIAQKHFFSLVESLKKKMPNLHVADTLCSFVENREEELVSFAKENNVIVFIGGRNSSNTKVLFQKILSFNPRAYLIENVNDIEKSWFVSNDIVGVSGSASTPMWQIEEVKLVIEEMTSDL